MEYSLLQAVTELYQYQNKKEPLVFELLFYNGKADEETGKHTFNRIVYFGKKYNKVLKEWQYCIQEKNVPTFAYTEYNFLANLAKVKGITGYFNTVEYIVKKEGTELEKEIELEKDID